MVFSGFNLWCALLGVVLASTGPSTASAAVGLSSQAVSSVGSALDSQAESRRFEPGRRDAVSSLVEFTLRFMFSRSRQMLARTHFKALSHPSAPFRLERKAFLSSDGGNRSDKRRGAVRRVLTALTTTRLLSLEPAVIFLAGSRRVAVAMLHLRGGERLNEPLFMTMVHGPGVGQRSPLPGY
ncbi:hypothetical protein MHYP_G00327730 [Metynnis hypsauchen]